MEKKFDARFVLAATLAAAVAGAVAVGSYFVMQPRDDDDRPIIIVRSGSVDMLQTKKWKWHSSAHQKQARPDHPNGASISGFVLTLDNADIGGTATGCSKLSVGESVEIEYKPTANTSESVKFTYVVVGSGASAKNEPLIESPSNMTIDNGGAEKKLTHGTAGQGWIASVTVTNTGVPQKCTPNGGKFTADIGVKPY